ncbi:MAG: hypothetical protein F6K28_17545 [Microcoleus sp. SIO2G3]|nr:hypothetical protein [Microcoleus sp. SIO2G3]
MPKRANFSNHSTMSAIALLKLGHVSVPLRGFSSRKVQFQALDESALEVSVPLRGFSSRKD